MSDLRSSLNALLEPVEEGMERMRAVLIEQMQERSGAVSDMTDTDHPPSTGTTAPAM